MWNIFLAFTWHDTYFCFFRHHNYYGRKQYTVFKMSLSYPGFRNIYTSPVHSVAEKKVVIICLFSYLAVYPGSHLQKIMRCPFRVFDFSLSKCFGTGIVLHIPRLNHTIKFYINCIEMMPPKKTHSDASMHHSFHENFDPMQMVDGSYVKSVRRETRRKIPRNKTWHEYI